MGNVLLDSDIFAEALERPSGERADFLQARCADDAQRARIERLLAAHVLAPAVLPPPFRVSTRAVAEKGTRVGRYRLQEKIGEGGCGVVWMAQQETPVRRRVAVKMIKLGMDTREVIARFDAERQALSMMDHPHIARVIDAGATENGRPYFVMELVRGQPITRYCDERNLAMADRLALFARVCRAVDYAHGRGVVHRDLKPSNVLVTNDGYQPLPKVIDFGIAKSLQGRLTEATVFTAFEQFLGTPAYMSPEQADFSAHEVDACSDVYSLGVLLYEMLTGQPPFDPKTLNSAGFAEARRIIREDDPPRPSTKLNTVARLERATLAERRGLAAADHVSLLTGDLEQVVMKAIAKNRAHRYSSAAALAADVERFLRHEPVEARVRRRFPALWRFVQRHRVELIAALLVAAAGVFAFAQSRRAARAEAEQRRLLQLQATPPPPAPPPTNSVSPPPPARPRT